MSMRLHIFLIVSLLLCVCVSKLITRNKMMLNAYCMSMIFKVCLDNVYISIICILVRDLRPSHNNEVLVKCVWYDRWLCNGL